MSIHFKGVLACVQEFCISTNHVQQPDSAVHHDRRSSGGKVHSKNPHMDPYMEDHTKYFPKFGVCITVFMHGVLSYLSTSNPSLATLEVTGEIYLMNL